MTHRTALLAVLFFSLISAINAQKSPDTKSAAKPTKAKAVNSEEADALHTQQKLIAVSLLTSLADDARSFKDQALRARVEARTADAIWDTDPDKARALFRRAWEQAEASDAEAARIQNEDEERQQRESGVVVRRGSRDLRAEVLRIVAKRDDALGEEFLKKLAEADERAMKETRLDPASASLSDAKRLQLARQLLTDGQTERAMRFAGPALNAVNRESINFLSALREKNLAAADQGFLSLTARAARDPLSDANTVSGLSSYAFTPFLYVTFLKEGGANMWQERRDVPAPDLSPQVRDTFFRVATQILLRPLAPPEQDQTTSGRHGKYMVIRRLLPLFEQYAAEQAQLLKTQMAALAPDVPAADRTGENRAITRGIVPDDTSRNPLDRMQERLDRARTSQERDAIYADYAVSVAAKDAAKSRELVDKIENSELRKNVRAYLDFEAAQRAIKGNEPLEAARLARSGELTSPQRIWTFSRAARLLMKTDSPRAVELLDEAAAEARRIGGNSPDRAKGLVAIATVMMSSDRVRAWEIVNEALKAANASEGFTGEDSTVSALLRTSQMVVVSNANATEFDLLGLFRALAKDDFNRSVEAVKSFTGESPRAVATLAIASAILEKGPAEVGSL